MYRRSSATFARYHISGRVAKRGKDMTQAGSIAEQSHSVVKCPVHFPFIILYGTSAIYVRQMNRGLLAAD
jgi:hypothetical protein